MNHRLIVVALVLFGIIQVTIFPPKSLYIDTIWRIQEARSLVAGEALFRDIPTIMPMLVYFFSIPVVIWKYLGGDLSWISVIFLTTASVLSMIFLDAILRLDTKYSRSISFGAMFLYLAFFSIFGMFSGQKEHLFLVFALPYLGVSWLYLNSIVPPRWMVVIAIGMGMVGFTLKPFWALVPVVLWMRGAWIKRSWVSVDFWMCVGCGVYLGGLFLNKDFWEFLEVIKLAYPAYKPAEGMWHLWWQSWTVILMLGCWVRFRKYWQALGISSDLALVGGVLLGLAVFQGKGFYYHYFSSGVICLAVVVGVMASVMRNNLSSKKLKPQLALLAAGFLMVACVAYYMFFYYLYWNVYTSRTDQVLDLGVAQLQQLAKGEAIYHMSVNSDAIPFIHFSGSEFGSRFFGLVWIERLQQVGQGDEEFKFVEEYFMKSVREDLVVNPPKVILYDNRLVNDPNVRFGLWEYLSDYEDIGKTLSRYSEVPSVTGNYRVFVLKD